MCDTEDDMMRLLHGTAMVMSGLYDLAREIEIETLQTLDSALPGARPMTSIQNLDLLMQSLAEMRRLLDGTPEKLSAGHPYEEFVTDINLEYLRAYFDSTLSNERSQLSLGNAPVMTVFDEQP